MPVRFHCTHCHQRLSVASRMRGNDVKCPRCRRVIRVPAPASSPETSPDISPLETQEQGGAQVSFPDVVADVVGRSKSLDSISSEGPASVATPVATENGTMAHRLTVPRYVLYTQGFLLGTVALVFFVFGLVIGSRSRDVPADRLAGKPPSVSGTVMHAGPGEDPAPDAQSVIILLPGSRQGDQKASIAGLRPEEPMPDEDHSSLQMLRSVGGDYTRADRRGRYRVRGASPGRYTLLILSRHCSRPAGESPQASHLAFLGRFFVPANELLAGGAYRWQELLLRDDQQVEVTFRHR